MPTTNWNSTTIDGKDYLVIDSASFRVPLDWDPSSNMFIAVAAPTGGLGNFPALVQGDPGPPPTIDTAINLTALEYGDATADSATWTEISPDTYQLGLVLHKGEPGADGSASLINASDLTGSPVAGKIIVVNATADGFEYSTQRVGDRYIPASVNSTSAGNATSTLCSVAVPPQGFDWRPDVSGQCVVTGTGANVTVDLIARLANESTGNIVGRAMGVPGVGPFTNVLAAGPPTGSADAYDRVSGASTATLYLRAERQSGADTFTTSASTTSFCVRVCPIPSIVPGS
jgi:hypothetical protein